MVEIKRLLGPLLRQSGELRFAVVARKASQVGSFEIHSGRGKYYLRGNSIDYPEFRPQNLVSPENLVQCFFQCSPVERSSQADAARQILSRIVRMQLVEYPKSFLGH
jgi:hypothetical protein